MAQIIGDEGGHKKGGKRRPKKHSTHLDMTPMVDLMCLLITFFMLTTAFSKPKVMEITMPEKGDTTQKDTKSPTIPAWRTFNIILSGNDKIYWYIGMPSDTAPIKKTDYSKDGIRKLLLAKNKTLFTKIADLREKVLTGELVMADSTLNRQIKDLKREDAKSKSGGPIILIKADEKAKYRNIVDIIDEMAITSIASYAVVDIDPKEKGILARMPQ